MNLSVTGYAALVTELMALAAELCGRRLICALEGGYHLEVLAHSVLSTLRVLTGSDKGVSDPFGLAPTGERNISTLIDRLQKLHGIKDAPFYSI